MCNRDSYISSAPRTPPYIGGTPHDVLCWWRLAQKKILPLSCSEAAGLLHDAASSLSSKALVVAFFKCCEWRAQRAAAVVKEGLAFTWPACLSLRSELMMLVNLWGGLKKYKNLYCFFKKLTWISFTFHPVPQLVLEPHSFPFGLDFL